MTQPVGIGSARAMAIGAVATTGAPGGTLAGQAMTVLTNRVAGTLTRALELAPGATTSLSPADPYGVEAVARDLATALHAGPADAGRLSRALNDFTSEVAVLVAASPTSATLDRLSRLGDTPPAPDGRPGRTDADHALATVESAILQLRHVY